MLAGSGLQLGITQFGKGTCECGAYSGGIKTVNRLFNKKDRTLAIGIFNGGSVIGATIAPPLIVFLFQHFGFRMAFLVPTLAALLWIPLWWVLYRKEPKVVAAVAGQAVISIAAMLSQSSTWAVMLCRFFIGPVMQFYWYWIPSYLFAARHLTMIQIGHDWLDSVPHGRRGRHCGRMVCGPADAPRLPCVTRGASRCMAAPCLSYQYRRAFPGWAGPGDDHDLRGDCRRQFSLGAICSLRSLTCSRTARWDAPRASWALPGAWAECCFPC